MYVVCRELTTKVFLGINLEPTATSADVDLHSAIEEFYTLGLCATFDVTFIYLVNDMPCHMSVLICYIPSTFSKTAVSLYFFYRLIFMFV